MEKKMIKIFLQSAILLLLALVTPLAAQAAATESTGSEQTSGRHPVDGMTLPGDMIMLGNAVQSGVEAMAHLKDVEKTMADRGSKMTHHFMVVFVDRETGELIEAGSAAVKYSYQNQQPGAPIPLTAMQGHYGADLALQGPGEYQFIIGSQLADGRKRQFQFDFTLR